ncbi:putative GrpE nucleotide exchange factor [Helianthus annuus]|nr:putative GrpE nucleotide exchange factor [Helianthus annuus]KAJ0640529.1 putative GrpE nucleotide exchange factor [Helianthus annuus]KAJ0644464.1 putative GrpE nucleotide exchange factor [Helianthus annuus]KAJ0835410.1 putative GrpE nucleotide exchange factor [Helianthus annuus]
MENIMDRTKREADNSKKFAIQNIAKSLLNVADNLDKASLVVKESFSKIDASKDTTGAFPLLKMVLEGVEMTEKQLAEVFKKFGVEKYDPTNKEFDPNRHNAVFQTYGIKHMSFIELFNNIWLFKLGHLFIIRQHKIRSCFHFRQDIIN